MGLARAVVSRLRQYVGDRRHSNRQRVRLPFTILFGGPARAVKGTHRAVTLEGHTLDVSAGGLALIVPAIRVGEHHLVGEGPHFKLRLELAEGPIEMKVATVRYESLDEGANETGFIVGVKIVEMEEAERRRYSEYISKLTNQSLAK